MMASRAAELLISFIARILPPARYADKDKTSKFMAFSTDGNIVQMIQKSALERGDEQIRVFAVLIRRDLGHELVVGESF